MVSQHIKASRAKKQTLCARVRQFIHQFQLRRTEEKNDEQENEIWWNSRAHHQTSAIEWWRENRTESIGNADCWKGAGNAGRRKKKKNYGKSYFARARSKHALPASLHSTAICSILASSVLTSWWLLHFIARRISFFVLFIRIESIKHMRHEQREEWTSTHTHNIHTLELFHARIVVKLRRQCNMCQRMNEWVAEHALTVETRNHCAYRYSLLLCSISTHPIGDIFQRH